MPGKFHKAPALTDPGHPGFVNNHKQDGKEPFTPIISRQGVQEQGSGSNEGVCILLSMLHTLLEFFPQ